MTPAIIQITKPIHFIIIINYVSIQLTYISFIKLYLTNFWNKKKAIINFSHSVAILVTGTVREIEESKAGAKNKMVLVTWARFLPTLHSQQHACIGLEDSQLYGNENGPAKWFKQSRHS